jgi:hypothetical protein
MSDLAILLGGVVALILAALGYGRLERRKGKQEAEDDAQKADTERALGIRRRVDRADDSLRKYDDAGFRD